MFTGAAIVFLSPVAEQTCCTMVYVKVVCETRCPKMKVFVFANADAMTRETRNTGVASVQQ